MEGKSPRRKRKLTALRSKSSRLDTVQEPQPKKVTEIEGVNKITLTRTTQKAIGCVIEQDVSTDNPWIYIKKEKFEDNIDLHEESSEFLPIKDEILEYPENEILLGFDIQGQEAGDTFYLCLTSEARVEVLKFLEREKNSIEERLLNSVDKPVGEWSTYGSELEVDENIMKNFRPLYDVKIKTKFPIHETDPKFSLRLVDGAVDGYIELLSTRFPFNNVKRKRIDANSQISPEVIDREAQTNPSYPMNAWTQYEYDYEPPKETVQDRKAVLNFFGKHLSNFYEKLQFNEEVNLHINDYDDLVRNIRPKMVFGAHELVYFQDVIACKGKKVSAVSWHPTISGILAAAYIRTPYNQIVTEEPTIDLVQDTVHGKHLVIIWCYIDSLVPKLYLHAHREVFSISFCPYNPNILIGGCGNGQIVIWDITNKIKSVETKEVFTPVEQKHRLIISSLMTWMKSVPNINIVHPIVVSHLDYGHRSAINSITWLPQNYKVNRNGNVVETDEKHPSSQFLTCGVDSIIYVWDLLEKSSQVQNKLPTKRKTQRLRINPSALQTNKSLYADLGPLIRPHYKLVLENAITKARLPVSSISMTRQEINYIPLDEDGLENPMVRTYFKVGDPEPFVFQPKFLISTTNGVVGECSWVGLDFDQGQQINFETCHVKPYTSIHDGPIKTCCKSPFFPHIFLTIGGHVFAVWNQVCSDTPLFWRKSKVRYVSGMWSSFHPGIVIINRYDSMFELWDLTQRTRLPNRLQRISGNASLDAYTEALKKHTRKHTFCLVDAVGALKIFRVPEILTTNNPLQTDQFLDVLERVDQRRSGLKSWLKVLKSKSQLIQIQNVPSVKVQETTTELQENPEPSVSQIKSTTFEALAAGVTWKEKQERYMYEVLLRKKKINLVEIEQHKRPLQKLLEEKKYRLKKRDNLLAKKDAIFEAATDVILKDRIIDKKSPGHIDIHTEKIIPTKCAYIRAYRDMERDLYSYLKSHQFKHQFDWNRMIEMGKKRRERDISKTHLHVFKDYVVIAPEIPKTITNYADYYSTVSETADNLHVMSSNITKILRDPRSL